MIAGLALILFGIALYTWSSRDRARAVGDLPAAQRRAIYLRAVQDLTLTCPAGHDPALDPHCESQAGFVRLFPECDDACESLARQASSRTATR